MSGQQRQLNGRRYVEQLRISLGVRDVPPERAQEFVREVEAHLQASGEEAEETFGKPWELADALVAARPAPPVPRDAFGMGALAVAAFVGPWLVLQGGTPLLEGEPAVLTLAHVASLAVGLAAVPIALPVAFAFLDGRRSIWPAIGVFTCAIVAVVGVYLTVTEAVLYEGSGWPLVTLGGLALVATGGLINRRARRRPGVAAAVRSQPPPVAEQRANGVRRVLDTQVLRGASSGARAVAVIAVVLVGLLGGWILGARGPDLPAPLILLWGLLLGGLIGDAWGARRVRHQYGDDSAARVDGS